MLRDFRMARVSLQRLLFEEALAYKVGQYPFRLAALEGDLPGVRKASW